MRGLRYEFYVVGRAIYYDGRVVLPGDEPRTTASHRVTIEQNDPELAANRAIALIGQYLAMAEWDGTPEVHLLREFGEDVVMRDLGGEVAPQLPLSA